MPDGPGPARAPAFPAAPRRQVGLATVATSGWLAGSWGVPSVIGASARLAAQAVPLVELPADLSTRTPSNTPRQAAFKRARTPVMNMERQNARHGSWDARMSPHRGHHLPALLGRN